MAISVFDLFKVGIGPSSSHTVGPMCAANLFVQALKDSDLLTQAGRVVAELYGSLGATGKGHGSANAIIMGLQGELPESVDVDTMADRINTISETGRIKLLGNHCIPFSRSDDLIFHRKQSLPFHPNGMIYTAYDTLGKVLMAKTYFSVGGGFIVDEHASQADPLIVDNHVMSYPFKSGAQLLALCDQHRLSIAELMLANEKSWRDVDTIYAGLNTIWDVMQRCVNSGCEKQGILPGGLKVRRRASALYQQLRLQPEVGLSDPLTVLDWVSLYALAVNEENAAGGRVVTAPTNGAAGIIPAVLHYYMRFVPTAKPEDVVEFLLTAGAIGILYKENASISGAEVGCQGEVGSACSMAAGALAAVLGGTPQQVENAAEIAMEHNLGLTCDPIGGLVQVPCIERNAMASVKAISAARLALRGDGEHFVSLDKVIKTMRETGRDMQDKYKETSRGGLALDVIEVPVNIIEC